jgi:DNA-directed RNA polymerase subunit K/omega
LVVALIVIPFSISHGNPVGAAITGVIFLVLAWRLWNGYRSMALIAARAAEIEAREPGAPDEVDGSLDQPLLDAEERRDEGKGPVPTPSVGDKERGRMDL